MEITQIFGFQPHEGHKLPLFTMSVSAGKPIPVDDDIETDIDLNEFLVDHPAATFFARVNGARMKGADIDDGDILIVDTSLPPKDGNVVVISMDGSLTVKVYREIDGDKFLESQNGQFLPLKIDPYMDLKPVGVVTKIIHSL